MRRAGIISVIAAMVALGVAGCSNNNSETENINLESITLTEELTISADHKAALIGDFSGLAVGNDGAIYAADTKLQKVHVFSPQGAYQDSIGRQGKGPGEFEQLNPDISVLADTLYTMQPNSRRVDLFNTTSGEPIRTISIPDAEIDGNSIGRLQQVFPQTDGSLLVYFMNPHFFKPEEGAAQKFSTVASVDASGNFINKNILQFPTLYPSGNQLVYRLGGGIYVFRTSIYPTRYLKADAGGTIYTGTSDSLLLRKYNQQGSQMAVMRGPQSPKEFTEADMDSLDKEDYQYFREAVNEAGVPEYWPAFQKVLIDDENRVWIQLMNPGNEHQSWQVFDAQGTPQWTLKLPAKVELFAVQQGKAYGIFSSEQSLPEIRRYAFEM